MPEDNPSGQTAAALADILATIAYNNGGFLEVPMMPPNVPLQLKWEADAEKHTITIQTFRLVPSGIPLEGK